MKKTRVNERDKQLLEIEKINRIKKLELAKLWGSDFWEGDLEKMRTIND